MGTSGSKTQTLQEQAANDRSIQLLTNEERQIHRCLESVRDHGLQCTPEVIVVDGGSLDNTVIIAKKSGAKVIKSPKGRGRQLNCGWKASRGDWLLFLHADSRLPSNYGISIQRTINSNPLSTWGAFSSIQTDVRGLSMEMVKIGVRLRTLFCKMPYGDQAYFVKATTMKKLNGFKDTRLLEDVDFVHRARKEGFGGPMLIPEAVFTSGRRWKELGIWRTTLINQGILIAYMLGVDDETLADWYYSKKTRR